MATVMWFRNDLRLRDQPALAEAAARAADADDEVVGLFVIDPELFDGAGRNRQVFLTRCLRALDESMGGALVVRRGDPAEVVAELAATVDAPSVHVTAATTPAGTRRDEGVTDALGEVDLVESGTPHAIAPGTILTNAGEPYKVFTPFYRSWKSHPRGSVTDDVEVRWAEAPSDGDLDPEPGDLPDLPPGGEAAAHERLDAFLAADADRYDAERNRPDLDTTSRLSPYLHFGCIHPRQLLERLGRSQAHETFRSEIAWREFYGDVLAQRPSSAWQALDERMASIELDTGDDADEKLEAWKEGRTGFPIVDAGMRQLLGEGWMHNRVRMITASFLVKDLHIDWTRGARHFLDHLVDGDVASNNHGWQWVAGTGTDAAPYFRVFNPTTQAKRFDPDGAYVRRWVPELRQVGDRHVHDPAAGPDGVPLGYVAPIVDHAVEREEALRRYEAVKAST